MKFFGGLTAIGAGLALGREGPSVQMGAAVAHIVGKMSARDWLDCKVLIAAGAGAGLATAFNAPIAGAVFVLEELVRRFDTRIAIAALGASAAAIAVARAILGAAPDFAVEPLSYVGVQLWPLFVALGAVAGLAGQSLQRSLAQSARCDGPAGPLADRSSRCRHWRGGRGAWLLRALSRWRRRRHHAACPRRRRDACHAPFGFSYCAFSSARCPTRPQRRADCLPLFWCWVPNWGCSAAPSAWLALPDAGLDPIAFAVVGMAGFFTGVVQAPVTGIVLVVEMTASFTMLLPMIAACFAAMLIPNLLRGAPIYDSLRERVYRMQQGEAAAAATRTADAQQEKTVEHQQGPCGGEHTAKPYERAGGGDDADRTDYDRDLKQGLGIVEIRITFGGMVSPGLQFLGLGEQFFLSVSGRRIAFVTVDPLAIALDPFLDLGPGGLRHVRQRKKLQVEFLRRDLVDGLANVSRLVEAVGIRRLNVRVDDCLGRVGAPSAVIASSIATMPR